jgi:hypothetical protein
LHLFYIEKQGLAMRQGKKDGAVATLLRNHPTFWSRHPARGYWGAQFRQTSPARLFDEALCMDIGIPGVFGVAVDRISVCLEMEINSGVFPDWRVNDFRRRSCLDQPDAR